MRHNIPKHYTLMIARSGKTPITVSFNPRVVLSILGGFSFAATLGGGSLIYQYVHQNQKTVKELVNENQDLTQQAQDILEQVEVLEAEIDALQDRAGVPKQTSKSQSRASGFQGGDSLPVDAKILLSAAKSQLPKLMVNFKESVEPALEKTLVKEEARPKGLPLRGNPEMTSRFGLRRNPFGGGYELHKGLDFVTAYGNPIHVTAPGVVIKAEASSGGYGNHVVVDHGFGFRTLYGHMSKIAVQVGDRVERDRVVGFLGNTGRSSGPHLHYEVRRDNLLVDPENYLH